MKLLANPLFLRSVVVLLGAIAAFVGGVALMRTLRRRILEDDFFSDGAGTEESFYPDPKIQELKQQQFALQSMSLNRTRSVSRTNGEHI